MSKKDPQILDANKTHETQYCIPLSIRDEQIRINTKKVAGRISDKRNEIKDSPVAIVGYGPSLEYTWEELKNFDVIISCSGSHRYLLDRGIIPTYHVEVDPRPHKIQLLGIPHEDVTYLPASCCHPTYIDHIVNNLGDKAKIELWHVFARDGEADLVIPRGEWSITGGADVGMRAMTIARFLGYTNFHIFGLDGSEGKTGKHAAAHPNQPKQSFSTVVNGRTFKTTPSLLECSKLVFHELDQLHDVNFKFYGDGMTQEMAKTYKRKQVMLSEIAEMRPTVISDKFKQMNAELHATNPYYGIGGAKYADRVRQLKSESIQSILDYGCGKGALQKALEFPIWQYDPAIEEFSSVPRPADLVICTDVLEHIEADKLNAVLSDLKRVTKQIGYFVIHLGAAKKVYSDGSNAHQIQKPAEWWKKQLQKFFDVASGKQEGNEAHFIVSPKTIQDTLSAESIIGVRGKDGIKSRFYIPNETTKWRAESLASKEPVTIEWLNNMPAGSVLYDIGANVGGYTIWSSVRGVSVFAFEPEAENYALLVRNIALNNSSAKAYPLAISDKTKVDVLHMSGRGAGGSCHSFAESVDPFGAHRNGNHPEQGCLGMSISELIDHGLPKPDYIKIDVDGFEPKVIDGAHEILKDVKGLLIEVNPALPDHLSMVDKLTKVFGFTYDKDQVEGSTRQAGAFKGVAEYVFYKQSAVDKHVCEAVEAAELISEPFPYMYIENVLPADEYDKLVSSLPADSKYVPIKRARGLRGYPNRFVLNADRPEWVEAFRTAIMNKFGLSKNVEYVDEAILIRDKAGYSIGPHSDHKQRVLSAIYYLTNSDDHPELGTMIYEPKNKDFRCEGGPHYGVDKFNKLKLMPYKPNSMFVFMKTDNSFHGVETTDHDRDVLLYDVQKEK